MPVSDTTQMDGSTTMDLGGRLTMHEMRRPVFVSPQLRSLQMALNMCLTMMSRNVVLGGYLERVILNGQLPGRVVKDKDGEERWVADPLDLGAGSLLIVPGIEYEQESKRDASGTSVKRGVTNPDVKYREPVDVTIFEKTKDLIYKAMLEEAHQLHYLLADQAASSGEARKEAIADFVMDLAKTVKAINRLYRWLLETVLAMTAYFAGEGFAGRYDQLRVEATTVIDTGRLSADDMRAISELIERGVISEETGMTWLGIQDTQAENERKETERAAQAEGEPEVDDIEALIDNAINNPPDDEDDDEDDVTGQIDRPPRQVQQSRNGVVPEPA